MTTRRAVTLVTVEFVAGFEGVGTKVSTEDGYRRGGWLYQCDGMPRATGCPNEIVVPRRYARFGTKSSGWWVTCGEDENGKQDKDMVLTFCPSCAQVIWKKQRS